MSASSPMPEHLWKLWERYPTTYTWTPGVSGIFDLPSHYLNARSPMPENLWKLMERYPTTYTWTHGVCGIFDLPGHYFNSRWNRDYRSQYSTLHIRGSRLYKKPSGWMRYGLQVGSYPDWMRSPSSNYAVSYHGSNQWAVARIVEQGKYSMRLAKREMHGKGIYSASDIDVVVKFTTPFYYKGRRFVVVLQNWIDLSRTTDIPYRSYYLTTDENAIRPYGLLIREV